MYPSSFDFQTNFCAIIYITEKPFFIIEFNSLSSLSCTIPGNCSPYNSWALLYAIFFISSSQPGMCGGHFSGDIGLILSHISLILFVFFTTTSYAFSGPKYWNSSSISFVVLKYKGACKSASAYPCPASRILLYISSWGSIKWTSQVATTSLPSFSPNSTIFLFISLNASSSATTPFLTKKALFPIGWISK